jgi:hypothetical protein
MHFLKVMKLPLAHLLLELPERTQWEEVYAMMQEEGQIIIGRGLNKWCLQRMEKLSN